MEPFKGKKAESRILRSCVTVVPGQAILVFQMLVKSSVEFYLWIGTWHFRLTVGLPNGLAQNSRLIMKQQAEVVGIAGTPIATSGPRLFAE